ncbi:putative electron transport protein YccM [anaerobic digester metagenome]
MLEKMTPSVLQRVIQSMFLVLCLHTGWQFHRFLLWATGASDVFVPRPASVEAFLPIAALMGLRRLLQTGAWDMVHPAALAILLAAMVTALVLRKGFCGYVCPVGLISGMLNALGRRLSMSRVPGPWAARLLSVPKYLALGFFIYTVFFGMDLAAIEQFAAGPYNYVADARMLRFFQSPSRTTLVVLAALLVLGTVLRSFWCRYLCPYGALLGLLSWASPTSVRRDPATCVQCGRCTRACPGCIRVQDMERVLSPECLGCMRCQEACPVAGCISLRAAGRTIPAWVTGVGSVAVMLGAWLLALQAGLWDQQVPTAMLQRFYRMFLE